MPGASNINIKEIDLSFSAPSLILGVHFVQGKTKRGPILNAKRLISGWETFLKIYGGYIEDSDFPHLAQRIFARGGQLRVNRVVHFTTITDPLTATALKPAEQIAIMTDGLDTYPVFGLQPKYPGADYNNLSFKIEAASNGETEFFNLVIEHSEESALNESYENLTIDGNPTVANSHYLDDVINTSALVDVLYKDLSAIVGQVRPDNASYQFAGGSDGDPLVTTDYIGDEAAKTGFHNFDEHSDSFQVAVPETDGKIAGLDLTNLNIAGSAYADGRRDLVYYAHLSNTLVTVQQLIDARKDTLIDSSYTAFYAGGLTILDPVNGSEKEISEMGDVLGVISFSDQETHPWFSFAGQTRGRITNTLGVVNNFGGNGNFNKRDLLARNQINLAIEDDNMVHVSGNFTGQLRTSKLSFLNVRRFLLVMKATLKPQLKGFIEQPLDTQLFSRIAREVRPSFERWVRDRAIYSWSWQGDQGVSSIDNVQINDPNDIDQGIYKVKAFVKIIPSLQQIGLNIIITPSGVNFEELE